MSKILKRLRGYNPPDRVLDNERQIATDVQEAANHIEALEDKLNKLENQFLIADKVAKSAERYITFEDDNDFDKLQEAIQAYSRQHHNARGQTDND